MNELTLPDIQILYMTLRWADDLNKRLTEPGNSIQINFPRYDLMMVDDGEGKGDMVLTTLDGSHLIQSDEVVPSNSELKMVKRISRNVKRWGMDEWLTSLLLLRDHPTDLDKHLIVHRWEW